MTTAPKDFGGCRFLWGIARWKRAGAGTGVGGASTALRAPETTIAEVAYKTYICDRLFVSGRSSPKKFRGKVQPFERIHSLTNNNINV